MPKGHPVGVSDPCELDVEGCDTRPWKNGPENDGKLRMYNDVHPCNLTLCKDYRAFGRLSEYPYSSIFDVSAEVKVGREYPAEYE